MARRDFENRIRELNKWKATDELTEVTFDMGHEAALTWNLPASYVCVVRAIKQDGTIQESIPTSVCSQAVHEIVTHAR